MTASSQTAASLNDLTSRIIRAAIEIHRALGPGLLESAYLVCLIFELSRMHLRFDRQRAIPLVYKDVRLDCAYRADVVVEDCVLLEVKALETVAPIHMRQLGTYVRLADLRVGLLLNFGQTTMAEGVHRYANRFPAVDRQDAEEAESAEESIVGRAEHAEAPDSEPERRRPAAPQARGKRVASRG